MGGELALEAFIDKTSFNSVDGFRQHFRAYDMCALGGIERQAVEQVNGEESSNKTVFQGGGVQGGSEFLQHGEPLLLQHVPADSHELDNLRIT